MVMDNKKVQGYIEHLKELGYAESTMLLRKQRLLRFVRMYPEERDWNDYTLKNFLVNRNEMFLNRKAREFRKSYLHALAGNIKRFLSYLGKEEPRRGTSATNLSWWEIQLQEYLYFCFHHQGLGEATLWKRRYFLSKFIQCMERHSINRAEGMRASVIMGFIRELKPGYSLSTVNSMNAALRGFLRYLYGKGIIKRDLSCVIISPRGYREQRIPNYLTDLELREVFKRMDRAKPEDFRDYSIFMLLIQYGLRLQEVARLEMDDINWSEKTLLIKDRKGQPYLVLPLTEQAENVLCRYINYFRPNFCSAYVFLTLKAPIRGLSKQTIGNMVRNRFRQAGIKGYTHLIRHTFAKRLIEKGVPLPVIQKLLGHKSISSTRIYARVNIKQLREVVENDSFFMEGGKIR